MTQRKCPFHDGNWANNSTNSDIINSVTINTNDIKSVNDNKDDDNDNAYKYEDVFNENFNRKNDKSNLKEKIISEKEVFFLKKNIFPRSILIFFQNVL